MTPVKLTTFYNKHKKVLYNAALRITGDSFDAEEIVQDTIIKYLRYSNLSMTEQQTEAWLRKCCVREAVDMLRRKKALIAAMERYAGEEPQPDISDEAWQSLLQTEAPEKMVTQIRRKLVELPVGYRTVLSLLLFEGYDYAEAAEIMKVSESTIRTQYIRGKKKLLELINN